MTNHPQMRLPFPLEEVRGEDIVFDLDGTLIVGDLGETVFYHYLLDASLESKALSNNSDSARRSKGSVRLYRGQVANTLMQYNELIASGQCDRAYELVARWLSKKSVDHLRAFIWGILDAGEDPIDVEYQLEIPEHDLIHQVATIGVRLRTGMGELVSRFQSFDAQIWIVSASPQIVVEAFADWIGIPRNRILAVKTSADGSEILSFPWRREKVDVLQKAGANHPLIAYGDSLDDGDMLAMARYPVVMADGDPGLVAEARRKKWLIF